MAKRNLTLYLPHYHEVANFVRVLDGTRHDIFTQMWHDILPHIGNPQETVNWGDPCAWIPKLLHDESETLAMRIWRESNESVNPRWSSYRWRFVTSHSLVEVVDGVCALTEFGKRFIEMDDATIRQIDDQEGIFLVLSELAFKGSSSLNDVLAGIRTFFRLHTSWKSHVTLRSALRYRLNNLRYRELAVRNGHNYDITDNGSDYLADVIGSVDRSALAVRLAANDRNGQARQQLRDFLATMDPYQFERLIARLFEAMEYDRVELTPYLKDKGVDIKADIEFGISSVHEVIQVKRQKGNIQQPIVSQLRGSLPLFDAIRGSIVTTGGFSRGAQEIAVVHNAPPISLIDGERLLDLLVEHDMGIRKREIRVLEFDQASLSEFESDEDLESASIEEEPSNE